MPTKQYQRQYKKKKKLAAVAHLGGKCVVCGERDFRCLEVDHVENDGYLEKVPRDSTYYNKVMKDDTGRYQLMCSNCNSIKRYEHREEQQRNT